MVMLSIPCDQEQSPSVDILMTPAAERCTYPSFPHRGTA